MNNKKLKIAYLLEDKSMGCSPAIKNTVKEVKEFLESKGHDLVPFPVEMLEYRDSFIKCVMSEKKLTMKFPKYLKGEYLYPAFN